tara:strand:- start:706 stop:2001 length:1296 start_codon:yes stop_codon:yes gene_type:complete
MSEKIIVPNLGESINEATVGKWLKEIGDEINEDDPLVELETDKVNIEVPSPSAGILSKVNYKNGETVSVGSQLGIVEKSANKTIKKVDKIEEPKSQENKSEETKRDVSNVIKLEKEPQLFEEKDEKPIILSNELEEANTKTTEEKSEENLSPAVRKIVKEKNIDVMSIEGTGKDGRILKGDIIKLMELEPQPSERKIKFGLEEKIKMTRLRLTIAKRLKEAQQNAAMLTTFNEVNMENIIQMRQDYQKDFQERFSIKLGFMSFFVKACIVGLKNFPSINAEIRGEDIIYKNYYNISFAVGTDRGLVVPVLKNTDEMSFAEIEKNIKSLSEKARDGKLVIDDLQGGTFTISNGGVYGSMLSTPILNSPQSGVLGMHNIVERPITIDGDIVSKPIMYLALSYDHRVIDGKESVSFLKCIKEHLEDPRRLFLKI